LNPQPKLSTDEPASDDDDTISMLLGRSSVGGLAHSAEGVLLLHMPPSASFGETKDIGEHNKALVATFLHEVSHLIKEKVNYQRLSSPNAARIGYEMTFPDPSSEQERQALINRTLIRFNNIIYEDNIPEDDITEQKMQEVEQYLFSFKRGVTIDESGLMRIKLIEDMPILYRNPDQHPAVQSWKAFQTFAVETTSDYAGSDPEGEFPEEAWAELVSRYLWPEGWNNPPSYFRNPDMPLPPEIGNFLESILQQARHEKAGVRARPYTIPPENRFTF
jgi:hypothetical protein